MMGEIACFRQVPRGAVADLAPIDAALLEVPA